MRPILSTLLLLLATLAFGTLSYWQIREGNLNALLGTPPVPVGEKIYPELDPEEVAAITLKSSALSASFTRTSAGWQALEPWADRMDPRAALAIIGFTTGARVEDLAPRDKIDPELSGLGENTIAVNLTDSSGQSLARYRLGRRTPWLNLPAGENPQPVPTLYLLPLESGRKSHVYAATGDILPLFKDGFKFLRDHRPFYFNPLGLEKIRIRTELGELTLGRQSPQSAWRIIKPLDLPTHTEAMKDLLEGLYDLQAVKLAGRSEVTLPVDGSTMPTRQIAITPFGSEQETVLEIHSPENAEARETLATVSDRPDAILTLLLKPEAGLVSLSDLPLTVNELRDPTLTNLNIASISAISIETATSPKILVSREPPAPWVATVQGRTQPANEQRLFDLLKAITNTRAAGFETDAAPADLSPWGLHRPILTLSFLAQDHQSLTLLFGLDSGGNLFAKRADSPTILRLDESFLNQIATRPHDWRHARLWSLSRVDLTRLTRTESGSTPLEMTYEFQHEDWQATQSGIDLSAELDHARANFLLTTLENLEVSRWLPPTDEAAAAALAEPALSFEVTENIVDDLGEDVGKKTRLLQLAPDAGQRLVYGKLSSDPSYFTLDPESYLKLNIPLLDP